MNVRLAEIFSIYLGSDRTQAHLLTVGTNAGMLTNIGRQLRNTGLTPRNRVSMKNSRFETRDIPRNPVSSLPKRKS